MKSITALLTKSPASVRDDLIARREIALLDVREEAAFAEGHPLFAANLPLSRIEIDVFMRIPRRNTPIVLFDDGEGLSTRAAAQLRALGYNDVKLLEGGLQGWCSSGGVVFRDVNVPSKAFGELVEARRHTPSLTAQEVKKLIDEGTDIKILDVRRFDEFQTMSIPTAISVPGAEVVLRVRELVPNPKTQIIVNCAGRTRSIIGTQSLINAGITNPVAALRNGTIGWTLANQTLDHGQDRTFRQIRKPELSAAAAAARSVADTAGVKGVDAETVAAWIEQGDMTVYRFDVRAPEEYQAGHLPGFRSAPGGQLVQETDVYAPVRGARIVLVDDDGTRANMTASWLAQMGWSVFVLDAMTPLDFSESGPWKAPTPDPPNIPQELLISPTRLNDWLNGGSASGLTVFDLAPSTHYSRCHIPGAWFVSRVHLVDAIKSISPAARCVLVSPDGIAAKFAWSELSDLTAKRAFVLDGGTDAWVTARFPADDSAPRYASQPIDRYHRPYEGTQASTAAMQAYLEWEYGLVEQLRADSTHGFFVV